MKTPRVPAVKPAMLAAYVEGEVTPSEASAVESVLAESALMRRRLARLHEIGDALSAPIPDLERRDLVVNWRRAAAGAESSCTSASVHRWPVLLYALAAAAAVTAVVLRRPAIEEFRTKSAALSAQDRARWAGIRVYDVDATGAPKRMVDRVRSGDGLLFSYTNLGPRPLGHLMIFAVDAGGQVRWFYPAYDREGTNPTSIRVERGEADMPLPDLVHHDLAPGPLVIHALFTDRPLGVLEVEALLRGRSDPAAPLSLPDAVDEVIPTQVDP